MTNTIGEILKEGKANKELDSIKGHLDMLNTELKSNTASIISAWPSAEQKSIKTELERMKTQIERYAKKMKSLQREI